MNETTQKPTITEAEYRERTQKWVDNVCHYRNLAIQLGAKPEQMLSEYDRNLVLNRTDDDPAGWEEDTPELWDDLERYEEALKRIVHFPFDVAASPQDDLASIKAIAEEALRV